MNHYVDSTISSSGNGSSWSQAWKNFSSINWAAVQPGDTIYISGGSAGKTYREALTVGASGNAAGKITITAGVDPGHDGAVILDGGNSLSMGVVIHGHNHVQVSDLDVRNFAGAGFSVKYANAGVVIQGNTVHSGDPGGGNARGYDVRNSVGTDAVIVTGNSFTTPAYTAAQTDGIWSSDNDGVVFEKNHIVISNSNTHGHSDGIQSYRDINITIRDNWFEQANTAISDNHGAWLSNTRNGGTIKFHDNLVLTPNLTADSAVTHWAESSWTENGTAEFVGNTIIGGRRALNFENSPDVEVYNNILQPVSGGVALYSYLGAPEPGKVDNNLFWSPSGTVANLGNGGLSWSQWQARGYDAHGVNADPLFANAGAKDFRLSAGSQAIDRGRLFAELGADQAGTARPQGAGYDIGAFERPAGTNTTTPPPANLNLTGTSSADTLAGGTGNDTLAGGDGTDLLTGSGGADLLSGGNGHDVLRGDAGADVLRGGTGNDTLTGGTDADRFFYTRTNGKDVVTDFAPGTDKLQLGTYTATEVTLRLATQDGIAGMEVAMPDGGRLFLQGVTALQAGDLLLAAAITPSLPWTSKTIHGSSGADVLKGGSDAELLLGGAGNDDLRGGRGNDILRGGTESDRLTGGAGIDIFAYAKGDGSDWVTDFTSATDQIRLEGIDPATVLQAVETRSGILGLELAFGTGGEVFLQGVTALKAGDLIFA